MNTSPLRQQPVLSSILHFIGAGIGMLSVLFIYPKDLQLYGTYGFLTNTASILVPFVSLGLGATMIKYFPHFKNDEKRHHGFLSFLLTGYVIGIFIFICTYLFIYPKLVQHFTSTDPKLIPFLIYLIPLTIFYVLYEFTCQYSLNFYQSALPSLLNTGMKIYLPLLFVLTVNSLLSQKTFVIGVCLYFMLAICCLLFYLKKINQLFISTDLQLWRHSDRNEMIRFAFYSIIGGTGAVIALRVDAMMVTGYVGAAENGKFSLAAFMSNAAFIPAAAIADILHPKIADIFKNASTEEIKKYYQKSLHSMLSTTLWLCMGLILCFPYLVQLMPNTNQISGILPTLIFLLLARIADAGTGANSHILSYSAFYKYETALMLIMAIINVILNTWLIPIMGISGAGLSTLISVSTFNIAKTLLVFYKIGIHPYSKKFFFILIIAIISFLTSYYFTFAINPLVMLFVKASILTLVFWILIFKCKLIPEFNDWLMSYYQIMARLFGLSVRG